MLAFPIYDEIDDNDAIPLEFDCYNNDDILEYMGACSELANLNEKNKEENEISGLNGSLVLLQKDDELVEVEVALPTP